MNYALKQFPYYCEAEKPYSAVFIGKNGVKTLDSLYTNTGTALGDTKVRLGEPEVEDSVRERCVLHGRLLSLTRALQERLFLIEEKAARKLSCVSPDPRLHYFVLANQRRVGIPVCPCQQ